MNKKLLVSCAGVSRVGKDSVAKFLIEDFTRVGIKAERFALADELKIDLKSFLMEKFGIDSFTDKTEEKSIIRPILVAYGGARRTQSQGTYWTDILTKKIKESDAEVAIVTDIRYDNRPEYPEDEVGWLRKQNGILIHIERILDDGSVLQPPNDDERKFDPIIKKQADFHISWKSFLEDQREIKKVDKVFDKILKLL